MYSCPSYSTEVNMRKRCSWEDMCTSPSSKSDRRSCRHKTWQQNEQQTGRTECDSRIHQLKMFTVQNRNSLKWYERRGTHQINQSGNSSHICSFSRQQNLQNISFWIVLKVYIISLESTLFSSLSLKHRAAHLQHRIDLRPTSIAHHYSLYHSHLLLAASMKSCGFGLISCSRECIQMVINREVFNFKPFFSLPLGPRTPRISLGSASIIISRYIHS